MLPSVVTKEKRPEAVAMRTACNVFTFSLHQDIFPQGELYYFKLI
jgi:hypothetical protein